MPPDDETDLFRRRCEPGVRDELVARYLPLAYKLAQRYARSGQPIDDLKQVASIGLINAVDRFDISREIRFVSFAVPTILGELKRYHRDRGWAIRVPRILQENGARIKTAVPQLCQTLGRSPTIAEIAAYTGLSTEDVLEGMEAQDAYTSSSLDFTVHRDGGSETLADRVTVEDPGFEVAEEWADATPMLMDLPTRERRIIALRFFHDRTQAEIAEEIGVSQMHVSRLLSQTLAALRDSAETAAAGSA